MAAMTNMNTPKNNVPIKQAVRQVKISVKSLVQRVEQSGDIHFRFSSRSNAIDGIRGHQKLQKSRGEHYQAEQAVSDIVQYPEFELHINGRADGCFTDPDNFIVEEIKTIRVDLRKLPDPIKKIHWAQVKVYGYLLGLEQGVSELTLRLTYFNLDEAKEYCFDDHRTLAALANEYRRLVDGYAKFVQRMFDWHRVRDPSIETMTLPYGEFRRGQREMAVSVYRALQSKHQLVMQAPTGIGKTLGSLFPAVKALQEMDYQRLFYLSAKTSGQKMAISAIQDMRDQGLKLRDVTLTAKEKICFNPGVPCDPDYCEYAKGYYDKLPKVLEIAMQDTGGFDRSKIEQLAKDHDVCPFELSLDLTDIADIVIGDYNYVFDPTIYLRRHFDEPGTYGLLMDESHNLVDRGRDMFSASLCKEDVLALKRSVGAMNGELKKALNAINRQMLEIVRPVEESARLEAFPDSLYRSLRRFSELAEAWLDEQQSNPELLTLYFEVLRFNRVAEEADQDYAYLVDKSRGKTVLKLFCVNPAKGLAAGFERMSASVCFSATLGPQEYFKSLMGLGTDSLWYQIPSPFDANNLGVFTTSFLSTTYNNRAGSLYDLVDTLALIVGAKKGNYLVFFPSHAYLQMVLTKFRERHPGVYTISQSSSMSEEAREQFLDEFQYVEQEKDQAVLGFAVMGGIFGEGVDLKGSRLIGAIVVGVGLPQVGTERNTIRDYFEATGKGFEFAYQFPGMNRVLQTAGRVIRSESDRGIVCLIDHRFNDSTYRALFPEHWQVNQARHQQNLGQMLTRFWQRHVSDD
jgi:DNA excision repair protein ERCC-2